MSNDRSQAENVADGFYRIADILRERPIPGLELLNNPAAPPPGNPKLCEACLDGVTIATHYHQLVGHVCDLHHDECRQLEAGPREHVYRGIRHTENYRKAEVYVNGWPLPMTDHARFISPTGFEWGFGGSGPAALAHSILAHEFGEEAEYLSHQDFKWAVVAELAHTGWTLTSSQIRAAVQPRRRPPTHDLTC